MSKYGKTYDTKSSYGATLGFRQQDNQGHHLRYSKPSTVVNHQPTMLRNGFDNYLRNRR